MPSAAAALHLHDMGQRVRAPQVLGVELHRLAAGGLGNGVLAAFLPGEALAGEQRAVAGQPGAPLRLDALDRGAHRRRPAEPEIVEVREPEGEHVERMREENLLPQGDRAIEVAGDPGLERGEVLLLARRRLGDGLSRRARGFARRRHLVLVEGEQHEVAAQDLRQREVLVFFQRRGEVLCGVGAVLEVGDQRAVERLRRRGGVGGERQAVQVSRHERAPSWCQKMPRAERTTCFSGGRPGWRGAAMRAAACSRAHPDRMRGNDRAGR